MSLRAYLPSAQLTLIVVSLAVSASVVFAADYVTKHKNTPTIGVITAQDGTSGSNTTDNSGWEATLYAIQAANASTSIQIPDQNTVQGFLQAAQSDNLTTTIGRTLFVNLSNATAQGLGADFPTQDKLIAVANAQLGSGNKTPSYTMRNLTIVADSAATQRTYGNTFVTVALKHPRANQNDTLLAIGYATDNNDPAQLQKLAPIEAEYRALAKDLAAVPVPQTLAPLHLQLVNDIVVLADTYPQMEKLLTDPVQGLVGIKSSQLTLNEISRLFTNIAQNLSKDGILFTKDEPGSVWRAILSP